MLALRIRAENKSNSESEIFVLPTIEYDSSSDKIAGVALPIVSTGFLRSIETPHEKNDLILSLDVTTDNFLSFNPLISIWFFVSEILPPSTFRILVEQEMTSSSCDAMTTAFPFAESSSIQLLSRLLENKSRPSEGSSRKTILGVSQKRWSHSREDGESPPQSCRKSRNSIFTPVGKPPFIQG